ncbi:MAG: hypothetical protein IPH75_10820 [bacterium]|nr:hypothetical protein [bacterium]
MVLRFTDSRDTCEPFVNWEEIIGEPYTDVNGNGVYDNGIDGFIRSSDQSINQDLNYNGRRDGPENMHPSQWEPMIPLDDLDGNGTIRLGNEYLSPDCAYAPFVDWNGNGVWDSAVNEGTLLGRWEAYGYDPASVQHFVSGIDSAYYFLSDSGKHYWFVGSQMSPELKIEFTQYSYYGFINNGIYLRLADSASIHEHRSESVSIREGDEIKRHTRFLNDFEFGDIKLDEVLHIRFDSASWRYTYHEQFRNASWDLYFVKGVGLIQADIRCRDYFGVFEQHFIISEQFTGSFPLPLTKVDRP